MRLRIQSILLHPQLLLLRIVRLLTLLLIFPLGTNHRQILHIAAFHLSKLTPRTGSIPQTITREAVKYPPFYPSYFRIHHKNSCSGRSHDTMVSSSLHSSHLIYSKQQQYLPVVALELANNSNRPSEDHLMTAPTNNNSTTSAIMSLDPTMDQCVDMTLQPVLPTAVTTTTNINQDHTTTNTQTPSSVMIGTTTEDKILPPVVEHHYKRKVSEIYTTDDTNATFIEKQNDSSTNGIIDGHKVISDVDSTTYGGDTSSMASGNSDVLIFPRSSQSNTYFQSTICIPKPLAVVREPLRFSFTGYTLWLELEQFPITLSDNNIHKKSVVSDLDHIIEIAAIENGLEPIPKPHVTLLYGMEHFECEEDVKGLFQGEGFRQILKQSLLGDTGAGDAGLFKSIGVLSDISFDGVDGECMDMAWSEMSLATSTAHEKMLHATHQLFHYHKTENDVSPFSQPEQRWKPHLSLAYDNPENTIITLPKTIELLSRYPTLMKERRVEAVSLWSTYGTMKEWTEVDRIKLKDL